MGNDFSEGARPHTQGYWTPTDKARRAEAYGRARRVHSALARPLVPAWVVADYSPSDSKGAVQSTLDSVSLSPAAQSHRQRATKLSLGFRCQILEQLAEDSARLEDRLRFISTACDFAVAVHSHAPSGGCCVASLQTPAAGREYGSGGVPFRHPGVSSAKPAPPVSPRLQPPQTLTAFDVAMDLERTPRRPPTPATAPRPTATAAAAVAEVSAGLLQRPSPSPSSSAPPSRAATDPLRAAALAAAASGIFTPIAAGAPAAWLTDGPTGLYSSLAPQAAPPGARRRLSFGNASLGEPHLRVASGAASTNAKMTHAPGSAVVSSRVALRPQPLPTSAAATTSGLASAALAEAARAAAAGRQLAAAAALRVAEAAVGLATPTAAAAAAAGEGSEMRKLTWQAPVELLPEGSLQKFADARDGLWPSSQAPHAVRQYDLSYQASHLSHRERLHVGMAELNAELYSSWSALVASGAV